MLVERIKSGIIGLDDKMGGGFVKGSVNLITGKTGTGKTSFCSSFLYQGAMEGEPGVYITTEERGEDIKKDIQAMFDWDFTALEQKGLIKILSIKPIFPNKDNIDDISRLIRMYIFDLLSKIEKVITDSNAKRVVVDSVSIIELFIKDEYISRVALNALTEKLREMGVTALLTGTIPEISEGLSGGGIIEYIVDSVIKLDFVPVAEEYKRTLTVRKMRRTDHSTMIHPFQVTKEGIRVIEI
jgi:KaiC/GvpD/RAD55 family RecA-like ATPase